LVIDVAAGVIGGIAGGIVSAELTGGDVGKAALFGALGGGLSGGLGSLGASGASGSLFDPISGQAYTATTPSFTQGIVDTVHNATNLPNSVINTVLKAAEGAGIGAGKALISGTDPGQGALAGGISGLGSGAGQSLSDIASQTNLPANVVQAVLDTAGKAGFGAAAAAATGQDVGLSALQGAAQGFVPPALREAYDGAKAAYSAAVDAYNSVVAAFSGADASAQSAAQQAAQDAYAQIVTPAQDQLNTLEQQGQQYLDSYKAGLISQIQDAQAKYDQALAAVNQEPWAIRIVNGEAPPPTGPRGSSNLNAYEAAKPIADAYQQAYQNVQTVLQQSTSEWDSIQQMVQSQFDSNSQPLIQAIQNAGSDPAVQQAYNSTYQQQIAPVQQQAAQAAQNVTATESDLQSTTQQLRQFGVGVDPELIATAQDAADQYGIPRNLFLAQIGQESSWDPNAGAGTAHVGIGQFDAATAQQFNIDPNDPVASLYAAAALDAQRYAKTGSYVGMLQSYGTLPGDLNSLNDNQKALLSSAQTIDQATAIQPMTGTGGLDLSALNPVGSAQAAQIAPTTWQDFQNQGGNLAGATITYDLQDGTGPKTGVIASLQGNVGVRLTDGAFVGTQLIQTVSGNTGGTDTAGAQAGAGGAGGAPPAPADQAQQGFSSGPDLYGGYNAQLYKLTGLTPPSGQGTSASASSQQPGTTAASTSGVQDAIPFNEQGISTQDRAIMNLAGLSSAPSTGAASGGSTGTSAGFGGTGTGAGGQGTGTGAGGQEGGTGGGGTGGTGTGTGGEGTGTGGGDGGGSPVNLDFSAGTVPLGQRRPAGTSGQQSGPTGPTTPDIPGPGSQALAQALAAPSIGYSPGGDIFGVLGKRTPVWNKSSLRAEDTSGVSG
jgi:soluble lytic murein transglycosylase-like protein